MIQNQVWVIIPIPKCKKPINHEIQLSFKYENLLCSAQHSKRGQESFFYIQSEDILTKQGQNFSPRFVTMCTVLTLSNMGLGGMDVILSLYVPGMFRGV